MAAMVFSLLIVENANVFSVLTERAVRILESGMEVSSRRYIYQALDELPVEVMGVGLGHANLLLTRQMGSKAMSSYLSLYLRTIYSLGFLGFVLLVWFLITPLLKGVRHWGRLSRETLPFWSLAGYFAWLAMFGFRSEEPTFMFAVVFALLLYSVSPRAPGNTIWSRGT